MFKVARRWRLIHANPLEDAEMPRVDVSEMAILTEAEIASLLATYRRLEQDADDDKKWWALARHVVEFALGTAMRRGEIIGLRWRDVELLERRLHVRETIVRGKVVSPKSRSSRRTMELWPRTATVLDEVWQVSLYRADDSFVFGHPTLGTALDPTKLSRDYMRPALSAAGITKPFRPWHDLRHTASPMRLPPGTRTRMFRRGPGTRRARPTATSTRLRCCSPVPPRRPRPACSGPRGSKTGSNSRDHGSPERRKALVYRAFPVAGAGFEPATSGL